MKRYITGFNGLRTLGVLAVILYHVYPTTFRGGFLGVVLFFVLSAYLVTDSLLREYQKNRKLRIFSFWGRRLKRLLPSLIAVFVVITPYLLLFQQNLLRGLRENFLTSLLFVQNWWQIQQGNSYFANISGESPFKHLYYLAIEGQFFLLWPLLLWALLKFLKNRGKIFLVISFFALISVILMAVWFVPGEDPTRVYYGTDTRVFSLLMGASLAFIWPLNQLSDKINARGKRLATQLTIVVFLLILLAYFFMPAESGITYYGGMWLVSLLTMVLIALVAHPALSANRLFTNLVFNYIGSRSYGIYLWQLPVFALADAKLLHPTMWYNVLWQVVLIIGLSELSYRFVELPGVKFDYSDVPNRVWQFIRGGNWRTRSKVLKSGILVILLGIFAVILFSPPSPKDQGVLEKQIMAQQAVLKVIENQKANEQVSLPLKNIAQKYDVQPVVAEQASKMKVLAVGDSVMVAGSTDLKEMFPQITFSAEVGEQVQTGITFLENNQPQVAASDVILIGLGTNGLLTSGSGVDYVAQIMQEAAGKPVYWINVQAPDKPWVLPNNDQLAQEAKKYSNLKIIDWYSASAKQTDWFYSDLIHPNSQGAIAYTTLVTKNLVKTKS